MDEICCSKHLADPTVRNLLTAKLITRDRIHFLCVAPVVYKRSRLKATCGAADAEFEDLCFEYGIELDDVVSWRPSC